MVVMAAAIRRAFTRSTARSPFLRSGGKRFAAAIWMRFTLIVRETPEARALEEARLANLAERTRLENL